MAQDDRTASFEEDPTRRLPPHPTRTADYEQLLSRELMRHRETSLI